MDPRRQADQDHKNADRPEVFDKHKGKQGQADSPGRHSQVALVVDSGRDPTGAKGCEEISKGDH